MVQHDFNEFMELDGARRDIWVVAEHCQPVREGNYINVMQRSKIILATHLISCSAYHTSIDFYARIFFVLANNLQSMLTQGVPPVYPKKRVLLGRNCSNWSTLNLGIEIGMWIKVITPKILVGDFPAIIRASASPLACSYRQFFT